MPDLGLEVLLKGNNMLRLLQGLWAAVEISLVSIVTSFPLGIILGIIMTKENILNLSVLCHSLSCCLLYFLEVQKFLE